MADFSKIDWMALVTLVGEVQKEVLALQQAVGAANQAQAIGDLAETFISAAEALSGKDFVDNDVLKQLVVDLVKVMADVQALKPRPPV